MTVEEKTVYLTREGYNKLKEELAWRTTVRRPEIAKQIEEARLEGDISENAGYDEAKYQAGMNEGRIMELTEKLKHAVIIDKSNGPANEVSLGRTVTLLDLDYNSKEKYTVVGSSEADPSHGRISNESPIGLALLGKKVGTEVQVATPGGEVRFKILEIE